MITQAPCIFPGQAGPRSYTHCLSGGPPGIRDEVLSPLSPPGLEGAGGGGPGGLPAELMPQPNWDLDAFTCLPLPVLWLLLILTCLLMSPGAWHARSWRFTPSTQERARFLLLLIRVKHLECDFSPPLPPTVFFWLVLKSHGSASGCKAELIYRPFRGLI